MILALLAALALFTENIVSVLAMQAQERGRRILTGIISAILWVIGIYATNISLVDLQGKNQGLKYAVIGLGVVATILGSYVGMRIGARLLNEQAETRSDIYGLQNEINNLRLHLGMKAKSFPVRATPNDKRILSNLRRKGPPFYF